MKAKKWRKTNPKKIGIIALISVLLLAGNLFRVCTKYEASDIFAYDQRNDGAKSYIEKVSYKDRSYKDSEISKYLSKGSNYDDPKGYEIKIPQKASVIKITDGKNSWEDSVKAGENYMIYNLIPGQLYDYSLCDENGKELEKSSLVATGGLRMIYLNGRLNVRDLGGWPADGGTTRYGLLIRGAAIRRNEGLRVMDNDLQILSDQVGIKREIDIRRDDEVWGPDEKIDTEDDITYSDIPGASYERINIKSYVQALNQRKSGYPDLVECLRTIMNYAVAGETTYFHCMVGADRTGTLAFLMEGLLGMSQSDMDKEYELTSFTDGTNRPRNGQDYHYRELVAHFKEIPGDSWQDKFVQWFSCAGFTEKEMNDFRKAMIDGSPTPVKVMGHQYGDSEIVKEATVFEEGKKETTCKICKDEITETIPVVKATVKLSDDKKTIRRRRSFTLTIDQLAKGDSVESVKAKDETIVSISKIDDTHYNIRARRTGETKITVKLKSGEKAKCKVTVQ